MSDWSEAEELIERCVDEFGALDGLVNNAGLYEMCRPEELDEGLLRRIIDVNLLGTAFCGAHAIRRMLAQGHGSIVNVTSGAQTGLPYLSAYGASKAGVAALIRSWAADLVGTGVRVNGLSPMARGQRSGRRLPALGCVRVGARSDRPDPGARALRDGAAYPVHARGQPRGLDRGLRCRGLRRWRGSGRGHVSASPGWPAPAPARGQPSLSAALRDADCAAVLGDDQSLAVGGPAVCAPPVPRATPGAVICRETTMQRGTL